MPTLDPTVNFGKVTVSAGYDDTATSIVLSSGDGATLPDPSTDGAFNLVWWDASDYADPGDDPNVEIVRVTAKSTDTLTVTRAQEGTSASTHNEAGKTYRMALSWTDKFRDDLETALPKLQVSSNDTTPDYLLNKVISSDGSVTITEDTDGGDESIDLAAGGGGAWTLIESQSVTSNVAAVDFTTGIDSTYERYMVLLSRVKPSQDAQVLQMVISTDGGSTWEEGATDYEWVVHRQYSNGNDNIFTEDNAYIPITEGTGNSVDEGGDAQIDFRPASTNVDAVILWKAFIHDGGTVPYKMSDGGGVYKGSNADINAIRFQYQNGNIAKGEFDLYGVTK